MNTTTPRLTTGTVVPNFTLPAVDGATVTRSSYRARKHLALIFAPVVDLIFRAYLEQLRDAYAEIHAVDSEILAVVSDSAASADGLRAAIELPFPLLLDPDSSATQRFLPDGAAYGVFILDRYGALHSQWTLTSPPLPEVQTVVEWLGVLDNQCTL